MSEIMTKPYGRIYKNKSNVSITPFDIYNLYPVGSIYISVNSTNPSNYFGGTWERISQGRFLIGAGAPVANNETSFGDLNNGGYVFNANGMGGQYTHTLTVNEMPVHSHGMDDSGWHSHGQNVTANAGTGGSGVREDYIRDASGLSSYPQGINTAGGGGHRHNIWNNGSGWSHNNVPPYFGVYIWKRVA